jgi:alpha-tubulin suppressor-like RCC1 family protein
MDDVIAVAAGQDYSLAIKTDYSLWAWGSNIYGQLGDGTTTVYIDDKNQLEEIGDRDKTTPVKVMENVTHVTAGHYHCLAITADDGFWAWRNNHSGQLGDGTNIDRYTPIKITVDQETPIK